jgi:hypothetical protein
MITFDHPPDDERKKKLVKRRKNVFFGFFNFSSEKLFFSQNIRVQNNCIF